MIGCREFYQLLRDEGFDFFAGVPDSLLRSFLAYLTDHAPADGHVITAHEGSAVGCAAGHYLATGRPALVYMQNSGLGNSVNPLTSLVDREVYSIPMLLLVGWRGEPGTSDEPQHVKQGRISEAILRSLEIPYTVLPGDMAEAAQAVETAVRHMAEERAPYALLVRKNSFDAYSPGDHDPAGYPLTREEAIRTVVSCLAETDVIVSTTGKTSRELFELREGLDQGHQRDFLTVGSMGHASAIALGIALRKPDRTVYCFDGDGALIMHMGSLTSIGKLHPRNFRHIVFNNFAHESVGGQPTAGDVMDVPGVALASGYETAFSASTEAEIRGHLRGTRTDAGPSLLEIRVSTGSRADLGRPTTTPQENKEAFMAFLDRP